MPNWLKGVEKELYYYPFFSNSKPLWTRLKDFRYNTSLHRHLQQ